MQVQKTNGMTFTSLQGIHYLGNFNPDKPKHAKVVKEVVNSPAINNLGAEYDFIANLKCSIIGSPLYKTVYELFLTPVKETTSSEVKNLPSYFNVCYSAYENSQRAYEEFMCGLKGLTSKSVENNLNYQIAEQERMQSEI